MSQITLQTLDFSSLGFPSVGEFYLGVDVDGIPKLRRYSDTIPLYATSSGYLQYFSVPYSDFLNLYNTSSLEPGSVYVINNFRTSHYIQYTDSVGDGTGLGESINFGTIEPLVVVATSNSTYNSDVKSLVHPDDEIKWVHELTDREYDHYNNPSGVGRGHIIYRKSAAGNSRNYDFRNVVFWRWNDGSGNYTIIRRVDAPNMFDYKVFKAFEEGFEEFKNNEIGSLLQVPNSLNKPYYLDNLVISTFSSAISNKIDVAFESTIDCLTFSNNKIKFVDNSIFQTNQSFEFNNFDSVINSNLGNFEKNIGIQIYQSTINVSIENSFVNINHCTFSTFHRNNINSVSGIQVSTYSENISALTKDKTEILNTNSGRILFTSDLDFNPLLGTYARVITESDDLVFSTSSSYLTSTASGGFQPYLGIGTIDPLKKLHIQNSGILISGNESEQSFILNDNNWSRLVIDSESSTTQSLADFRNNNGRILYVGGSNHPSVSIGTMSSDYILTVNNFNQNLLTVGTSGQINIGTVSLDSSIESYLVWNSSSGNVFYREMPQLLVQDIATNSFSATLSGKTDEYFGVSHSSTTYFNLPLLSSVSDGKVFTIKDESGLASINPIVIQAGSSTIDGSTQSILAVNYGSLTIVKKSNGWWII